MYNYIYVYNYIYNYTYIYIYICGNPPVRGGMGILKGVVNFTFKGNIQHGSTEFLGNQKIPNPIKLYIQREYSTYFNRVSRIIKSLPALNFLFKGNIQHILTEFLGNQKIPAPVKLYIQRDYSTCFNRVSRES